MWSIIWLARGSLGFMLAGSVFSRILRIGISLSIARQAPKAIRCAPIIIRFFHDCIIQRNTIGMIFLLHLTSLTAISFVSLQFNPSQLDYRIDSPPASLISYHKSPLLTQGNLILPHRRQRSKILKHFNVGTPFDMRLLPFVAKGIHREVDDTLLISASFGRTWEANFRAC